MSTPVVLAYLCPNCEGATLLPDPASPFGVRRADTAGAVEVGRRGDLAWVTCCFCGYRWAWARVLVEAEEEGAET